MRLEIEKYIKTEDGLNIAAKHWFNNSKRGRYASPPLITLETAINKALNYETEGQYTPVDEFIENKAALYTSLEILVERFGLNKSEGE